MLVTPIDESAPKGRLILPQQQTIRDILEAGAMAFVTRETELSQTLAALKEPPCMVITDSQAFAKVSKDVPESVPLTSFSILFARYKGSLEQAVRGVTALEEIQNGDKVLISEGCTHHRQCNDIGTVKLPNWIRQKTGKEPEFVFTSGGEFPQDLSPYRLIVHCGGCMLNERENAVPKSPGGPAGRAHDQLWDSDCLYDRDFKAQCRAVPGYCCFVIRRTAYFSGGIFMEQRPLRGRFAPSPSGRMHLGKFILCFNGMAASTGLWRGDGSPH